MPIAASIMRMSAPNWSSTWGRCTFTATSTPR